jgi:alkanesulfonate monooxygenase SsuD/methylene tetrahydromethanopterin reductase-like flavin-dependent oxidoreductase (luciferase family)
MTAQFAEQVRLLRAALAAAERDAATFRIAKRVYIAVDDDADRARHQLDAALERVYGRSGLPPWGVAGPPQACAEGLRAVAAAGAELIQLTPLFDVAEQMERLAAEVIPEVA